MLRAKKLNINGLMLRQKEPEVQALKVLAGRDCQYVPEKCGMDAIINVDLNVAPESVWMTVKRHLCNSGYLVIVLNSENV